MKGNSWESALIQVLAVQALVADSNSSPIIRIYGDGRGLRPITHPSRKNSTSYFVLPLCKSWIYLVKSQINLTHFFLIPIWCTDPKSGIALWKCQFKNLPRLFDPFATHQSWKQVDNWLRDRLRQEKSRGSFWKWYFEQLSLDLWWEYQMWMRKKWVTKIWWPFSKTLLYSQLLENDPPPRFWLIYCVAVTQRWPPNAKACVCESVRLRKRAPPKAGAWRKPSARVKFLAPSRAARTHIFSEKWQYP